MFIVKFVSEKSNDEFLALPTKLRAKMAQMILLLEKFGKLGEPHTKKLQDEFYELRIKAQEGIARAIYVYQKDKAILILVVFVKNHKRRQKPFWIRQNND